MHFIPGTFSVPVPLALLPPHFDQVMSVMIVSDEMPRGSSSPPCGQSTMRSVGFDTGLFLKVPSVPAFAEVPKHTARTGSLAGVSAASAGKAAEPSSSAAAVITVSIRFMAYVYPPRTALLRPAHPVVSRAKQL